MKGSALNAPTGSGSRDALIGAAAVMIAVLFAEWLKRNHERKNVVRACTIALVLKVPYVVTGMTNTGQPMDTNLGSPWWNYRESVMDLLITVMNTPTRFQRKANLIKSQAMELNARIAAAEIDFMIHHRQLTFAESLDISTTELFKTVFGSHPDMESLVDSFRKTSLVRSSSAPKNSRPLLRRLFKRGFE